MFWDRYTIVSKDNKWDFCLFDENLWNQLAFKFKNKQYEVYVQKAFPGAIGDIERNKKVIMRGLYLT